MIRFLLRLIGFLVLAAGFVALIVDGTRSIAARALTVTPAEQTWASLSPETLASVKAALGGVAEPVLAVVLSAPTFAPLVVLGVLLMLIGGKSRRTVGVTP